MHHGNPPRSGGEPDGTVYDVHSSGRNREREQSIYGPLAEARPPLHAHGGAIKIMVYILIKLEAGSTRICMEEYENAMLLAESRKFLSDNAEYIDHKTVLEEYGLSEADLDALM